MCDHGDDKGSDYLANAELPGYEIYVCECGALINLQDRKNYEGKDYAMTYQEIFGLIEDIIQEEKKHMRDVLTMFMHERL